VHATRLAYGAPVALILVISASGCSAPSPVARDAIVGQTLAEAAAVLPEDSISIVQDASPRVGVDPSYNGSQAGSSQWTIVAACADSDNLLDAGQIEIAVLPTGSVDEGVSAAIANGDFEDAVSCDFAVPTP
jgi:hypothetical protein